MEELSKNVCPPPGPLPNLSVRRLHRWQYLQRSIDMGIASSRWREGRPRSKPQTFTGADFEGLPELSDLLCGKPGASGLEWERPPYSLLIFLEGSLVKFCFTAGDKYPKCWGTVESLAGGLLAI